MNGTRKRSLGGDAVYDGEGEYTGGRRHNYLSEETKVVVSRELKTYLITHQVRLPSPLTTLYSVFNLYIPIHT